MSWELEQSTTLIPKGDGSDYEVTPGSIYPAGYIGSKYSIRRVEGKISLSLKSYSGNHVESSTLPKNLLKTIREIKGEHSGTIRIRWNGDTILAPQYGNPPLYIGKMRYGEGAGLNFPGLELDRHKSGTLSVYAGPQSALDVGEKWSVPGCKGNIRPKLTRRHRGGRTNTITEHPQLVDYVVHNILWEGKRLYVNNFGHVITPVNIHLLRSKGVDLAKSVGEFDEQGLFNSARFTYERAERTNKSLGRPWVMAVIGHVDDFDDQGPHPDLSTGTSLPLNDDEAWEGQ